MLLQPAALTGLVLLLVLALTLMAEGGDPLALARLGTYYSQGNPSGTRGYDGQFVYYIARDPAPQAVAVYLDAPAYRYQRILYPLLARLAAFGQPAWLPWSLLFIGVVSHITGVWLLSQLLKAGGVSGWYALPYGLFAGFLLAVRLDLPEPLAFALVLAAFVVQGQAAGYSRGRQPLSWLFLGLAVFTKETTAIFTAAAIAAALANRRWRDVGGLMCVAVLPFAAFQFWLWQVFGQFGLGSGGDMATPFEIIPLMGLLRIGFFSWPYFIAMLVVFGPAVILPALWGIRVSVRKLAGGDWDMVGLSLLANALVIFFLPFSTFREPGGLLRFACALVLVVILAASRYGSLRVLRYSYLWLALNVFLFKS